MKRILIYLVLLLVPSVNEARRLDPDVLHSVKSFGEDIYSAIRLAETGLGRDIFDLALKGLNKLDSYGKLLNNNILTIADYSQSSTRKRLYVIDLKNRKLLFNTYVAHGRNTGSEFATKFSNKDGSLKSSLGFFITSQPIIGSHTGFSLLLDGVEKGFNDHANRREIIVHGADYVSEEFIRKYGRLGRSFGCPTLPPELNQSIIETIKGGTCFFIYNPDHQYLNNSRLLH